MNPLLAPFPKSPTAQVIVIVGDEEGAGLDAARRAAGSKARVAAARFDLVATAAAVFAAGLALGAVLTARDRLRLAGARREGRHQERARQARRQARHGT